jgi:hypothetical protein
MRVVCLSCHWKSLQEIFRDLHYFFVAPYRVQVIWS